MKIDINNYEQWMMDYLDGNLDQSLSEEMEAFLLKHPHIAEEIEELDQIHLENTIKSELPSSFIGELKKPEIKTYSEITENNYEKFFIAGIENDLNIKEQENLHHFLSQNEFLKKEYELFNQSRLQADEKIIYPFISDLYRKEKRIIPMWIWPSVAAAILIIGFWVFNMNNDTPIRPNFEIATLEAKRIHVLNWHQENTLSAKDNAQIKVSVPVEFNKPEEHHIRVMPEMLASMEINTISIPNQDWRKQMDLMQGYAFEKNQLYSSVDWQKLPSENSKSAFRLISSMLWKTTKAQVQSFSEEVYNELPKLSSNSLETFSGGVISVKRPVKEKE